MQPLMSICLFGLLVGSAWAGDYLGCLNCSEYDPDSVQNPYGKYGSPYSPDSMNNQYGQYGSPSSPKSPTNPYTTTPPQAFQNGQYKGDVTVNPTNPNRLNSPVRPINPYAPIDVWTP